MENEAYSGLCHRMSGSMMSEEAERLEKLPLEVWHRTNGARMVPFAGYEMPIQYAGPFGGILAEHEWTRNHAGLFDVSHMGQLTVSGEGAREALEALLPADLASLHPGRIRYSLLLAEDGGILDDLMVTNRGDEFYLVVNGATKWDDIAHLRERLPDEITLNHLAEHALLALQGPEAAAALGRLGLTAAFEGMPSLDELGFMQAGPFFWEGRPLGVGRSGYTGEDGFEISIEGKDGERVARALLAESEVLPIGLGARDSLRLEAGLCLYGHDIDETVNPAEANLLWSIQKRRRTDRDFVGADKILDTTPAKKRVGILPVGKAPAREHTPVADKTGRIIGEITSGGFGPSVNGPVAMGYVETAFAADGAEVDLIVRGKPMPARIAPMPFFPHRYRRAN